MTFSTLLDLPAKGETCLFVTSSAEFAQQLGASPQRVLIAVDGKSDPASLFAAKFKEKKFSACVVDLTASSLTGKSLRTAFEKGNAFLKRREIKSWWCINSQDPSTLLSLKESVDYYANVSGQQIHFITARHTADPAFFLPAPIVGADQISPESADPLLQLLEKFPANVVLFGEDGKARYVNPRTTESFAFDIAALGERELKHLVAKDSLRDLLRFIVGLRTCGTATASLGILDYHRRRRDVEVQGSAMELQLTGAPGRYFLCTLRETGAALESDDLKEVWSTSTVVAQAIFRGQRAVAKSPTFDLLVDRLGAEPEFDKIFGKHARAIRKHVTDGEEGKLLLPLVTREGEGVVCEIEAAAVSGKRLLHVFVNEVSEREKTLARLHESEAVAGEVAAASRAGLLLVKEGLCISANATALSLLRYPSPLAISNKPFVDLCTARHRDEMTKTIATLDGETVIESRFHRNGGGSIPVEAVIRPVKTTQFEGLSILFSDITPLRKLKAELKLKVREQEILAPLLASFGTAVDPAAVAAGGLSALLKHLPFAGGAVFYLQNGAFSILAQENFPQTLSGPLASESEGSGVVGYVSKTMEVTLTAVGDYPPFLPFRAFWEKEGAAWVAYVPLAERERFEGILVLYATKDLATEEELRLLLGFAGKYMGQALASAREFGKLTGRENLYATILGKMPDVGYRCMGTGAVEYFSPRVVEVFGYRPDDFVRTGDLWRNMVHPDDRHIYSRRLSSQQEAGFEIFYRMLPRGKAEYLRVRDAGKFLHDAGGNFSGIIGTLSVLPQQDEAAAKVTALEAEIAHARRDVERKEKELQEFSAVVSHDLKEPLITIDGYSRILQDELPQEVRDQVGGYLDRVRAAAGRMKRLIDDLMLLARLGHEPPIEVSLEEVVREVIGEFDLNALHARVSYEPGLPTVMFGRGQLGMVLRNLVSNGLKFNKSPEPEVRIDVEEDAGRWIVSVRDNGIGIPAEHFADVFLMFRRLHHDAEFPGEGVGLTIVRRIVEAHGGEVWVESAAGSGATFSFTIPMRSL